MNREAVFPAIQVDEIMQSQKRSAKGLHVDYGRGIANLLPVVIGRIRELFREYAIPPRIVDARGALAAAAALFRIPVLLASIFSVHVRSLRVRSRRSCKKRAIYLIVGRKNPEVPIFTTSSRTTH
jgi:hypothetical protein